MANRQNPFKVIEGGSGGKSDKPLVDIGTAGQDKPTFKKPRASSGGGRGGGSQAVSIARLKSAFRAHLNGWLF